jgi:hypothetical protein
MCGAWVHMTLQQVLDNDLVILWAILGTLVTIAIPLVLASLVIVWRRK